MVMKSGLLIVWICIFALSGHSQLVNGGFETCSSFPTGTGQWNLSAGWNNAGSVVATPDFFHTMGSSSADLPETPLGWVEPFEGNAVMGFIACGRKYSNLREYLSQEFSEPLVTGQKYRLSFRLTNGILTPVSTAGLGVKGLAVLLSTSQPVQNGQNPLLESPQWVLDEVVYSREWVTYSLVFTASEPYSHLTLGVFGNDDDKVITPVEGHDPLYAYYFLDDFRLTRVIPGALQVGGIEQEESETEPASSFTQAPFFVPNSFTPNGDGHNDVFLPVPGSVNEWALSVYNSWGERVFYSEDESQGWNGWFNGHSAESGSYIWEVNYSIFSDGDGWQHKSEQGVVTLIR